MKNKFQKEVSREKDKIKRGFDWFLLGILVVLCLAGLSFLASSLSPKSVVEYQSEFFKQLFFGLWVGGVLTYFLARTDYHLILKYSKPLLWLTLTFLFFLAIIIVYTIFTGKSESAEKLAVIRAFNFLPIRPGLGGNAIRWIRLGPGADGILSFQPSELAKLTLLFYFTQSLQNLSQTTITWLSLKKPLYILLLTLSLIYIQPDLGTAAIIFGIACTAMYLGGVGGKIVGIITGIGVFCGILGILVVSYRGARLQTFLDIYRDHEKACNSEIQETKDRNRQVCGIRSALKRGEIWGKGYGKSTAKLDGSVPEINTDAILAVIGEEVGFVGTIIFLSLYVILFWKALQIAKNAPDIAGTALAAGIGFWVTSQAFLNIAGVTGLLPLKGIPLPFVSEGGSALVLNMMSVGILLNISSQSVPKKVKLPIQNSFNKLEIKN